MMKSLYQQQFAMMVGVMLLSFSLLSTAFMFLSYRYVIGEKRDALERNAGDIAGFTASYYQQFRNIRSDFYQGYVESIALIADSHVVVANPDGEIIYATDGETSTEPRGSYLPEGVVRSVMGEGSFAGMTNLGGIYPEQRYAAGLPVVTTELGGHMTTRGIVLVSADASMLTSIWLDTVLIFAMSATGGMMLAVLISTFTSARQAKPLSQMAAVARRFGRGEFDQRVVGYEKWVDEYGELARSFNTMASSLSELDKQRSEFIANVSHELKTPMTTISGFAEGILDGTIPPEKEKESLEIVVAETRRLSRLVRRMLDLSRMQAAGEGTMTAQERFDASEVICQVLASLEPKITARRLDVDLQLPDGKLMVWGNPDGVTQVCYNLLDNAAKFAAPGTDITVQVTRKNGKALVSIRNLGSTIPPDELPLLFDRFHKADYSRSMDREGVGLGLYIVKTILGSLKEDITVTSEDGVTQFTFTLTLA